MNKLKFKNIAHVALTGLLASSTLSFALISNVKAETLEPVAKVSESSATPSTSPTPGTQTTEQHVSKIKTAGTKQLTDRITSLNDFISKLGEAKKLTAEQRNNLTTDIQSQIDQLTTLKVRLNNESSVANAKEDFQNIFDEHFIYAYYLPKINRITAADKELDAISKLNAIVPKLQGYLDNSKTAGNDTTALQASLDELKAKLTDAGTKAQAAIDSLMSVSATNFKTSKSAISSAQTNIKTARSDLETARKDAKAIVAGLRKQLKTVE